MRVFMSGATGALGSGLAARLIERRHRVCALCGPGLHSQLPARCSRLTGDPSDAATFLPLMPRTDVFVHLMPWSGLWATGGSQCYGFEVAALRASVKAAVRRRVSHFVFVSVARPAPVRRRCQAVRAVCEMVLGDTGLNATILRPWYVAEPGSLWPLALNPLYKAAELIPASRPAALRLGVVSREELLRALVWSVETPVEGIRYVGVPAIRSLAECPLQPESETTSVTDA